MLCCAVQAAYTAIQAFQKRFPSAGEDAARLKEDVYALLEERAQQAQQRKLRLMQKKRAREEAQARRQAPPESETAVLATVSDLHAQSSIATPSQHTVSWSWLCSVLSTTYYQCEVLQRCCTRLRVCYMSCLPVISLTPSRLCYFQP